MRLRDYVIHNKKMEHESKNQFQAIFGVPLHPYMDVFTGFDIVKFDKDIGTPDGESLADFLVRKYGMKANELVESLL